MSASVAAIEKMIRPSVEALGCELWACQLVSSNRLILRVLVDVEGGVSIDQCQQVSRQIASVLDVEQVIKSAYSLEVSSPGLDRPLVKRDHYERYQGHQVKVTFFEPGQGKRSVTGLLLEVQEQGVIIEHEHERLEVLFESISKANVVPTF